MTKHRAQNPRDCRPKLFLPTNITPRRGLMNLCDNCQKDMPHSTTPSPKHTAHITKAWIVA